MEEFDHAVFKVLAKNDTGGALGKVGGVVIPKDISDFFPPLSMKSSAQDPTVDVLITADLFRENHYIETVQTRYQHQTWGALVAPNGA